MLSSEHMMARGAAEYADVLGALRAAGFPARFTQTGGMNAAIESVLDDGDRLLVTDAEDSFARSRADHAGWAVGFYPVGEGADPLGFRAQFVRYALTARSAPVAVADWSALPTDVRAVLPTADRIAAALHTSTLPGADAEPELPHRRTRHGRSARDGGRG